MIGCTSNNAQVNEPNIPTNDNSNQIPDSHYNLQQWFSLPTSFENQFPPKAQDRWKNNNPFLTTLNEVDKSCSNSDECITIVSDIIGQSVDDVNLDDSPEAKEYLKSKYDPKCINNQCYMMYNYILVYNYVPDDMMTADADYSS